MRFDVADRLRLLKVFHRVRFGVALVVAMVGVILGVAWVWPGALVITPLAFVALLDASMRLRADASSTWPSFVLDPVLVYLGMGLVGVPGEAMAIAFCQGAAATILLLPLGAAIALVVYSGIGLWMAVGGVIPQLVPAPADHAVVLGFVAGALFTVGLIVEILIISAEMGRLATEREGALEATRVLARSKDDLIVAVSHEIRTPLTSVLGLADELSTRVESFSQDEIAEFAALIAAESTEMAHLVEDLLVSSRGEDLRLKVERVDLAAEARAAAAVAARARQGTLPAVIGHAAAIGDGSRVRQVVRNLVTNAMTYGSPPVRVEVGESGTIAYVAVRDDGSGIPAEEVERAFSPFERVGGVATQPASIGVGLSVARGLARSMGGDLSYSRQGGVTSFVLRLPIAVTARQRIAS
jgi:signal transduction histidine kinase